MKQHLQRRSEQGSAIIYIFIAIAMFVALSFTVSNMMRGGGTGVNDELIRVHASEITQNADRMRRAVQTMRIDGVDVNRLSFDNSFISGYDNAACTDESCEMFNSAGGGVSYAVPDQEWIHDAGFGEDYYREWYFPNNVCVPEVGNGGSGCESDGQDNEELIVMLHYIKKPICLEINKLLNVENPNGEPPQDNGCAWTQNQDKRYDGSFEDGEAITSAPASILEGRQAGCFQIGTCASVTAGTYHFYQVLRAR